MVFVWHFLHSANGYPIKFNDTPYIFLLSIFDEGHTGVALFMTLSGYLFAKLIDNRKVNYWLFIYNRVLRLLPLLALVTLILGVQNFINGYGASDYFLSILTGLVLPTLPNGGWSITVEFHFYLILPMILYAVRKNKSYLIGFLILILIFRLILWYKLGEIQSLSYWTIIGRIDQFIFGILAFHLRKYIKRCHFLVITVFLAFCFLYYQFDILGGFYNYPSYPSVSSLWIIMPTIEAFTYGLGIAWYVESFSNFSNNKFSIFFAELGKYSYSIYLLHFFVVFREASFVHEHVMNMSNLYIGILWAMFFYILMWPIGYLSFRYIESPFLKYRKKYILI